MAGVFVGNEERDIDAAADRLRDDWNLLDLRRSNENRQTFEVVPGTGFECGSRRCQLT